MNAQLENMDTQEAQAGSCPFHHQNVDVAEARKLTELDTLVFPLHKRALMQYMESDEGTKELFIFYGDKEVSFDEPHLFSFGENLVKQDRFIATAATLWGEKYSWEVVSPLLTQLIEEGVLSYADAFEDEGELPKLRAPLLKPSENVEYKEWVDCESITKEITGKSLELGYLEMIVPVFRVVHTSVDQDGRQVGEANVFPTSLRVDAPTEWRTCPYSGTRYLHERPMNVTAMKAMRMNWDQMMKCLLEVRSAYIKLFPIKNNTWTVAEVERLAVMALSVPTYMMMRQKSAVKNGDLHPVLSNMFRVVDGLRMTVHQMLFVPSVEANLLPNTNITVAEIYAFAERNYSFHSPHGVCAGPQNMIEEMMNVLINGVSKTSYESVQLDDAVLEAMAEIKPAFEYGLRGLRTHFAAFSLWPAMTRAYEQVWNILQDWEEDEKSPLNLQINARFKRNIDTLKAVTYHATEELRQAREANYSRLYADCAHGLNIADTSITDRCVINEDFKNAAEFSKLLQAIEIAFFNENGPQNQYAEALATCLYQYFLNARALLSVALEEQFAINEVLGRYQPKNAFKATDIEIHLLLQGAEARKIPQLINEIEDLFRLNILVTNESLLIN